MSNEPRSESSEKPGSKKKRGLSRREFIAGTVGGVVIGAAAGAVTGALGFPKTVTQTETLTRTETQTATQTTTQTVSTTATSTVVQAPTPQYVKMTVNGTPVQLQVGVDVNPWDTLVNTLRDKLGLTGTKVSCDMGACGRCTVLADGTPILSCNTLVMDADGKSITTIEGLQDQASGKLHAVQQAFVNTAGAIQCGYCTPAMILTAKALLDVNPTATTADIVDALSGVVCRCGAYKFIADAVTLAESYH